MAEAGNRQPHALALFVPTPDREGTGLLRLRLEGARFGFAVRSALLLQRDLGGMG